MSLAVERYELGPIGTNCYVARAATTAAEAVVIDPGGNAIELERELARFGAACVAILITPRRPARPSTWAPWSGSRWSESATSPPQN